MKRIIPILILACLAGCVTPPRGLVRLDAKQILEVAKREVEAKCPEFRMNDFESFSINYNYSGDTPPWEEGEVTVMYLSREPTDDIQDWNGFTNNTHRLARIVLSNDGEIQKQNVSEWSEFPQWVYVTFDKVGVIKKEEDLSNNAIHQP